MGWDKVELRIMGRVSRHNSQQDKDDDSDWEELRHRIELIIREHRYDRLELDVW